MTPMRIVELIIEDMDHREFLGSAWRNLSDIEQDTIISTWTTIVHDGIVNMMDDWED